MYSKGKGRPQGGQPTRRPLLDAFVPPGSRGDVDVERRARFMAAVALASTIALTIGLAARVTLIGLGPVSLVAYGVLLTSWIMTPWLVRWTGSLSLGAGVYSLGLCGTVMVVAFQNAGPDTPLNLALILLPPFAIFVASTRVALVITAVAILEIAVMLYLELTGYAFPRADSSLVVIRAIALMLLLAMIFVIAWLYEGRRKLAQEAIQASEQRYVLATEASNEGVFDWDIATDAVVLSEQFLRLLDHDADTTIEGSSLAGERIAPADRETVVSAVEAHLRGEAPLDVECRLLVRGGQARWFHIRGAAVRDARGRPLRVAGTIQDIHARKETERLKDGFISTVNHELRTPLAAIRGALGLLHGQVSDTLPEQPAQLVEVAHRNSERLSTLVEDLLTLQRVDAGQFRVHVEDTCLRQCAEEAIAAMRIAVPDCIVEFSASTADTMVRADPKRVSQVVLNLLSNAVKYAPEGTAVRVRVEAGDSACRLSVSDDGQGLAAEHHEHVFGRFNQVDDSSKRNHSGSGLGLALARELVEAMDGRIGVISELNQGATFWFELPAA